MPTASDADSETSRRQIKEKLQNARFNIEQCEALFMQLGWVQKDVEKIFRQAQAYTETGAFDSGKLVDWLFSDDAITGRDESAELPPPSLGVIRLDCDYPPAPGDVDHSGSYSYDVYYRVVPGLTFEMCQTGQLTPDVKTEFIEAIKYLDKKGVTGITGDCGFMMWFQELARQYTSKPVFLSSLAHLPAITCAMGGDDLIAVFTADGKTLEPMRDLIKRDCNIELDDRRLVIVGCQDVPGFDASAEGGQVNAEEVQPGIVARSLETLTAFPNVQAILMECTRLPPYSDAVRAATGLPVFDAITCSDFFIRSRLDNPQVGLNHWQASWDGKQETYVFGKNLSEADLANIVNKQKLGAEHNLYVCPEDVEVPAYLQRQTGSLGVIRLDYDYEPAVGDIDSSGTFAYPVIYRVVPGLTYDMCVKGKMSDAVEKDFAAAIKYFDDRGVSGITCDCSMAMWFQDVARRHTRRPIFLSPVVQLPAVTSAFAACEQILIVTAVEADTKQLIPLIRSECGIDTEETRFFMLGVSDCEGFDDYLTGSRSNIKKLTSRICKKIIDKITSIPTICAILMESTVLSLFTDAVKAVCQLPVFDAVSVCDLFINGRMDNPLFGLQGWQKKWDGEQQKYVLGRNLNKEEKARLLHECHYTC